ncbi:MAG: HAD family hydrolase [Christensenellales bacterium]|jgi:phosphoglycolate phosphatase
MRYDLVIFDLDGTLLDTLGDLRNAANHALANADAAPRTREEVRAAIGDGLKMLLSRVLPADASDAEIERALQDFKDHYGEHMTAETKPYPGILPMLERLRDAGIAIAVHSNKYDAAVQSLCMEFFPNLYFRAVGESAQTPKKPDPAGTNAILAVSGHDRARTLFVGDSAVDLQTAKNAGVDAAWVSWGFRTRAEMGDIGNAPTFDRADALLEYLLN